ncbi:hypothetical protein R1sor_007718 [Riccia sorocarpa]|uniref:7,8-dihydroneopterin aldolase n=1 Tax=Riccia sorocarpa TaxID=122646 RepID=A0ABD3HRA2_9MARC
MARRLPARVLRTLGKYCELHAESDRFVSSSSLGAVRRFVGASCLSRAPCSLTALWKFPTEFNRSLSSSSKDHDTRVQERLGGKDRMILRGCKFQGYHGVLPEEKTLGQKFVVDLDAWLDLKRAAETDDLAHSVSYADVFSVIGKVVEGPGHNLVESVANEIVRSLFKAFPEIQELRVRIYKLSAPISGFSDKVGIEIYRTSSDYVDRS